MKKSFLTFVLLAICGLTFAQLQTVPQWNKVLSDSPETFRTQLVSSSESSIKVNVQVPGFYTTNVTTPRGEAKVITMPKAVSTAHAGEPEVPMTGIPAIIGDQARMSIRVLDAQYLDFEGIEVAPSKGDFPRTINPEDVPYTYGECYSQDAFFPANNVGLYEPYIVRDFRGQNMVVYPYAYNPVTKTLRVYYNMTVEMYKVDDNGSNVMETRRSNTIKMDPDFKSMYQRHFINYEAAMNRYTALDEEGDLLIICYDSFINNMTDFVNWKKTRGVNTTIVGTSTAGSSYSAIKTYIQNQYNANNNITHVLLVGDVAQIPGYSYSGGGSSYSGLGDNAYGQIVGSDIYNDVFIGRFSASSAARVTTQCNRVITYERDLTTSATWLKVGEGISRKENGSGHNNEDDYQHMNNIRTDLLNYGYTPVYQRYANLTGYDGSSATISSDINSGVGIINYANHGQETAWGANSSGYIYYSVSHVNALTNENKLPFIWSVACLVGKYDHSSDCFAEAWMNATNNNNPTGAIGTLMSYISQPWIPPMWAQDECVDILVESYSSNIKHTWGGTSINGLMGIFDHYSTSEQQAVGTYQAWILYGDPSLMLRTKTPSEMTVTHNGTIAPSATSYSVSVSNGSGAVATITDANHNILGKATVSGTTANISISGTLTVGTELTLCVFGYNKVTYLGTITVQGGTQYTIGATANPTAGGTVSGAGTYFENTQCTLTATPNTGYEFTNWTKNGTQVSTNATYSFNVTSSANYVANFTAVQQYTITATANPAEGGTVTGSGAYNSGATCTLTATAATGYTFSKWTKNGTQVSTNATYSFTVTGDATYVAVFTANTYTISATANPTAGGTISGAGTYTHGSTCTLTATPATGYTFTKWTKNGTAVSTNASYSFTVTATASYVAVFTLNSYDVTATANPTEGGTVTVGSSRSNRDDLVYDFEDGVQGWTVLKGDEGNSPNNWMHNTEYPTSNNNFSTGYGYNGSDGFMLSESYISGSSSGSGTAVTPDNYLVSPQVRLGGSISFYAGARNPSYCAEKFSVMVSTTNNTNTDSFTTLATWTLSLSQAGYNSSPYTVDLSAYSGMGYVAIRHYDCYDQWFLCVDNITIVEGENNSTGSGNFNHGESCTVTATPNTGYNFVNWTENGTAVSSNASYTFIVTSNRDLVANFSREQPSYTVTATANPTNGGTVSGGGTFDQGQSCTLTATANTGYTFTNWTKNGTQVSTNATYTFTVTESADYVANFTLNSYAVAATANPTAGGTITGAGSYNYGATATLIATANEGYTFTNWTKNGTQVSTNATYSFTVTGAASYVANFTLNTYTITALVNPENAGTVTGAGVYNYGDGVILTATANEGYSFVNWTEDGNVVCVNATCTSTATADRTLVANFEEITTNNEQQVTLNQGWGWWSTYLNINLNDLEAGLGSNGVSITSQSNGFVGNYSGTWTGSLQVLDLGQMYKLQTSANTTFTLNSTVLDPSEVTISLYPGCTWIGFPVSQSMGLNEAFAGANPSSGDMVGSYTSGFAQYYSGAWVGTLQSLEPGQGYTYTSNASGTKTFTYPAVTRNTTMPNVSTSDNYWVPVIGKYPNVMNLVVKANVNGEELVSETAEVAAFVNGECRGSAKLMYMEPIDAYVAFLTVYGVDDETFNFRLYNEGDEYDANEQAIMRSNVYVGQLTDPFILNANTTDEINLFPNPVERGEMVRMELTSKLNLNNAKVEIFNALGTLVRSEQLNQVVTEIQGLQTSGVYTVKVSDGQVVYFSKLVVK